MCQLRSSLALFLVLIALLSLSTLSFKATYYPSRSIRCTEFSQPLKSYVSNKLNVNLHMRSRDYPSSPSALHAIFDAKTNVESATQSVGNINKLFARCSWISWWFQIVLSIISAVILTFANTVRRGGSTQSLWASGFSFSAIGVIIAFVNCFWTFSATRLSRRIAANKVETKKIFPTLKRYCRTSIIVSLIGLLVSLIGECILELISPLKQSTKLL